tara:strand:+ start:445 stop:999 length:555 start_codon:yes stop_codon:yes gene_type:complete
MTFKNILYTSSKRAKHVSIQVSYPDFIKVIVPNTVSVNEAKIFVKRKQSWIFKQIDKNLSKIKRSVDLNLSDNELLLYKTNAIKHINKLSIKHSLSFQSIAFKKMTTRWGSCSFYNRITINTLVSGLPVYLQDYIYLHELLHTRIKNHSTTFWSELNNLVGSARSLDNELKNRYYIPRFRNNNN